jgi:murein L,D-transpeptidase YcbB/YkuD
VSRLFDQTPEVADPLGIMKDLASTANAGEYLKRQHPQHPQFELLRQALLKARGAKPTVSKNGEGKKTGAPTKKNAATVRRILANMERWRWMPRNLGSFYVWDDVPAQKVSVISDKKVLFHEKMVVGKPKTPTPIFSSDMEYIIFHPSWGVPPGMKRNELWPQLRNSNGGWFSSKPSASAVLRSHGLRVTRGGVPVNPDSVNWSKVNISSYHFTQAPGPTNVLGIVKFRFPNKHSVYMHDTPERHLFGDRERAFSHGCMRVQRPVRLAEVLLKHDKGWNKGQVKQKKRRGARIELSTPIAVHITYFTVVAGKNGKLDFRRDLYGLDRRVLSKLEGRNVMVGSLSTKRIKRTSYRKKRRIRRAAKKNKKPFNPFSSVLD